MVPGMVLVSAGCCSVWWRVTLRQYLLLLSAVIVLSCDPTTLVVSIAKTLQQ